MHFRAETKPQKLFLGGYPRQKGGLTGQTKFVIRHT